MRWLLLCIPLLAFAEDNAVERTAKKAANATERGVTRAANATERGVKRAAKGVERGARATDKALTNAAKKTDNWVKEKTRWKILRPFAARLEGEPQPVDRAGYRDFRYSTRSAFCCAFNPRPSRVL